MNPLTDADVVKALTAAIAASDSAAAWAKAHGFARGFICDVLAGRRDVSERLANALGYERVRGWQKATTPGRATGGGGAG